MGFDIKGKTALVTGANRGIGKAILDALLAQGAAKVYAAVRTPTSAQALVEAQSEKLELLQIDLNKPETIRSAAATARDVELVVSNAGTLNIASPLAENAIEALREEMEVNVFGLIRMAQAFAPVLKKNGGGAFVQLNSVLSLTCFPDFATYCASKAAAYSITQALRVVLQEQGTAVLSVHPGPIATDMGTEAGFGDSAESPAKVADGIIAALKSGDFHLFPDSVAEEIGEAYASFAKNVIEASSAGG